MVVRTISYKERKIFRSKWLRVNFLQNQFKQFFHLDLTFTKYSVSKVRKFLIKNKVFLIFSLFFCEFFENTGFYKNKTMDSNLLFRQFTTEVTSRNFQGGTVHKVLRVFNFFGHSPAMRIMYTFTAFEQKKAAARLRFLTFYRKPCNCNCK